MTATDYKLSRAKGPIACQYIGHSRIGEKESCTIYISLDTSRRLNFIYYVEKDTKCCF